jgi:hypothetical protein
MASQRSNTSTEQGQCLAHAKDLADSSNTQSSVLQGSLFEVQDGGDINGLSGFLNLLASMALGASKPPKYAVSMMDWSDGYVHISILGFRADDGQLAADESLGGLLEVIERALFVLEHGNPGMCITEFSSVDVQTIDYAQTTEYMQRRIFGKPSYGFIWRNHEG